MCRKQKQQLKKILTNELSKVEREFLFRYYCQAKTVKEIAKILNLSKSRISQMHSSIIARLKPIFKKGM